MRFGNEILCLALAISNATAFAPSSSHISNSRSIVRMERDLTPKDLIAKNRMKLTSAYTQTNTLRWEIRSTLTNSDEDVKKKETAASSSDGGEDDWPAFPEQLSNGVWDIKNDKQHA